MSTSSLRHVTGQFRALGTTIELTGVGIDRATLDRGLMTAIAFAEEWETIFSRFRSESELSRLNAANGEARRVSAELFEVIERSRVAFGRTNGRFDPSILPRLEAAGYDRDFGLVEMGKQPRTLAAEVAAAPGLAGISVDREYSTVRLPAGLRLDFGGIAKGAFVDRLAETFTAWPGGCVDAGGDLRVWGQPPSGSQWLVGVEDLHAPENDAFLAAVLDDRAAGIATSGTNRRRWLLADGHAHHLIDPATGRPTAGDVLSVTAFAASTVDAEVATKSLLVAAARGEPLDPIDAAVAIITHGDGRNRLIAGSAKDACRFVSLAADRRSA